MNYFLIIHLICCACIVFTVTCRAVKMSDETRIDVSLAILSLGAMAIAGLFLPLLQIVSITQHDHGAYHLDLPRWVYEWHPTPFSTFLLVSITCVQFVTSVSWRNGQPARFLKRPMRFKRRASDYVRTSK